MKFQFSLLIVLAQLPFYKQTLGWESVFYVFGGIGILWFFLWHVHDTFVIGEM